MAISQVFLMAILNINLCSDLLDKSLECTAHISPGRTFTPAAVSFPKQNTFVTWKQFMVLLGVFIYFWTFISRLSIYLENIDIVKKRLPVHSIDGLTLSYKVWLTVFLFNIWESVRICYNVAEKPVLSFSPFFKTGSVACWYCYQLRMPEDL